MALDLRPKAYLTEYKLKQDAHDYGMADDLWSLDAFKHSFRIVVVRTVYNDAPEEQSIEFDLIGCLPSIANAFRRMMISEVPSMAIEKVYMMNNTSIIQDEVLAHRLGLIPLKADPRLFGEKSDDAGDEGTDQDTLEFKLKVKCTRSKDPRKSACNGTLYDNQDIYSGQIKWVPKGNQGSLHKEADIGPVHDDILISKMRPGHEFDIRLFASKGVGKDHAKFSPVSTATYRLLPDITILRPVRGEDAQILQSCFSPGVIGIDADNQAYVKDSRYDTCSRNVYRYPHLSDAVEIARIRDHFIFSIESVGAYPPHDIFTEAVRLLRKKCQQYINELDGVSRR